MKIIIDRAIPYINGVLEPYADVAYMDAQSINAAAVRDADALIVRTRTKCGESLLGGSNVKFVATATAGKDHIDEVWCRNNGITVSSAPGCNAGGVVQYFYTSLFYLAECKGISLKGKTIGIVGVGNVGGRIAGLAEEFGLNALLCDPPRAAAEGGGKFVDLPVIAAESDIITFHVPLTKETMGMANANFFHPMHKNPIFANASRGEVVEDESLMAFRDRLSALFLDVWNNEPLISAEVMGAADLATPHIAGYSIAGKVNATVSAVRAFAGFAGIGALRDFYPAEFADRSKVMLPVSVRGKSQEQIASALTDIYPVWKDDSELRKAPGEFEKLRTQYQYRKEFYV